MASTITADNGVVSGSAGIKSSADSSGVLALASGTGTTAVTIDTSQNVGIGTSSPLAKLSIGSGSIADANVPIQMNAVASTGSAFIGFNNAGGYGLLVGYDNTVGYARVRNIANTAIAFSTNDIERARIDSSGRLLVGTTNVISDGRVVIGSPMATTNGLTVQSTSTSGTATYAYFLYNGTGTGAIQSTGTTTSYGTTSDYRLKENPQPMQNALVTVAQLKPCTYTWKADGSAGQGFIAHELQAVVPDCVTGEKDAVDENGNPVYQGIDTSFLVATLTAAIQEQQALITQLQADVTALKGNA